MRIWPKFYSAFIDSEYNFLILCKIQKQKLSKADTFHNPLTFSQQYHAESKLKFKAEPAFEIL